MDFDRIILKNLEKLPKGKIDDLNQFKSDMKGTLDEFQKHCEEYQKCKKCGSSITINGDKASCTKCGHSFKWLTQDMKGMKL